MEVLNFPEFHLLEYENIKLRELEGSLDSL